MDKHLRQDRKELKHLLAKALTEAKKNGGEAILSTEINGELITAAIEPPCNADKIVHATLSNYPFLGPISKFIDTSRFLAKSFEKVAVTTDFNGTPMTAYPNSTTREVYLDWQLNRLRKFGLS